MKSCYDCVHCKPETLPGLAGKNRCFAPAPIWYDEGTPTIENEPWHDHTMAEACAVFKPRLQKDEGPG